VLVSSIHEVAQEEHGVRLHATHQHSSPCEVRIAQELYRLRGLGFKV
jgi:hypothetical protein